MSQRYTLNEIARQLGAEVKGDANKTITGIASLASAQATDLTFIVAEKYLAELATSHAGAVIIGPDLADKVTIDAIVIKNPYLAYAKAAKLFAKPKITGIHPTAIIGNNVRLGHAIAIGAHTVIGDDCVIGEGTEIRANVTIEHGAIIGQHCVIQSGTVIGSDGFGNAKEGQRWVSIPQLGTVRIGNHVEIGANTTIDRGALDDTVIADGVRIDNLVQIAHNVQIGENTAIAAMTGIAGSAKIGKNCLIAGQVAINGHITICDNTVLMGRAAATNSIDEPGVYSSGTGLHEATAWRKMVARLRNLDKLARTVAKLSKESE